MSVNTSVNDGGGWKKKKKKYDVAKDPLALAPVAWTPKRPQPEFVPGIWEKEEIEDLSRYVDWHRQHPHCITPRPVKEEEDFRTGDKRLDEGNPKLLYQKVPGQTNPLPKEFAPPPIGKEADLDEVSVLAMSVEYDQILLNRFEREDPWYTMSVKDQLEQYHIDGSHTTVKTKRSKAQSVVSQFNKEQAWQVEQYGQYEGGYPTATPEQFDKLAELSLQDKFRLQNMNAKVKVGPWSKTRTFTKFTANGTALLDYAKLALERNIQNALALHEAEVKEEAAAMRAANSRKSSRKSKRAGKGKVVPAEYIDKYDAMRHKVGNSQHIEKMTRGFVRLAKKVAKHSKIEKNALETTMDLVEACNKMRIIKVNAMLLLESTDPNMKTAEDEPIFLHMFAKAVRMDQISGHQRLGTENLEPGDRKRILSVLSALAGKCDVDIIGREGVTAAHLAAIGDNSKLIDFLASKKADFEIFSTHDEGGMTPLMMAAKFGHVYVCADLIRHRADLHKVNRDGMNALHYACWFGQTRTAIFLMRIGADKFKKDYQDRTPARLAMDSNFMATGQAVSAFALRDRDVASQLEYLVEQEAKRNAKRGLMHALSRTKSFFQNLTMGQLSSGLQYAARAVFKQLRKWFVALQKEFCDYFELDFAPAKGEGSDADEEEEPEDPDLEAGVAENSGIDNSGVDNSGADNSMPGTSQSQRGNGAGGGGAFASVDGFQSVGESKQDDVIGFNDDFKSQ